MLKRVYKIYKDKMYIDSVEITESYAEQKADFFRYINSISNENWDIIPTNLYKHYSADSLLNS